VQHQIQRLIFASQQHNVSTFRKFTTLKNIVEVLHKLNKLMNNGQQIAFTEFSFQPSSEKFVGILRYPKPISRNVRIRILSSRIFYVLPMTKFIILTAIMT